MLGFASFLLLLFLSYFEAPKTIKSSSATRLNRRLSSPLIKTQKTTTREKS